MSRSPLTTCGGGALQEYTVQSWLVNEEIQTAAEVTLAQSPHDNSLLVFLNGLLLQAGAANDYIVSGLTLAFTSGMIFPGDLITVRYIGG